MAFISINTIHTLQHLYSPFNSNIQFIILINSYNKSIYCWFSKGSEGRWWSINLGWIGVQCDVCMMMCDGWLILILTSGEFVKCVMGIWSILINCDYYYVVWVMVRRGEYILEWILMMMREGGRGWWVYLIGGEWLVAKKGQWKRREREWGGLVVVLSILELDLIVVVDIKVQFRMGWG